MRSKQYFTSIKNNPHEISTAPFFIKIFQSGFAVGIQPDSKRKHKAITVVCLLGKTEDY